MSFWDCGVPLVGLDEKLFVYMEGFFTTQKNIPRKKYFCHTCRNIKLLYVSKKEIKMENIEEETAEIDVIELEGVAEIDVIDVIEEGDYVIDEMVYNEEEDSVEIYLK